MAAGRGADVSGAADALVGWGVRRSLQVALGSMLSALALVLGLLALRASAGGGASTTATPWLLTLLVSAAFMGLLCVVQGRFWQRAVRSWQGGGSADRLVRPSWVVHVVSYVVVVAGIFAAVAASHAVGFAGSVATLSTVALVPLVAAQVLGAVQVVRTDGPAGTVPTHVRRLAARIERSRRED